MKNDVYNPEQVPKSSDTDNQWKLVCRSEAYSNVFPVELGSLSCTMIVPLHYVTRTAITPDI